MASSSSSWPICWTAIAGPTNTPRDLWQLHRLGYPRMDPLRARGLNSHVMIQVRAHLPEWPHPDGRFLTELMIATGLRLGDACALGYDPLVFDDDANPYIRYWNHKMRREA